MFYKRDNDIFINQHVRNIMAKISFGYFIDDGLLSNVIKPLIITQWTRKGTQQTTQSEYSDRSNVFTAEGFGEKLAHLFTFSGQWILDMTDDSG